MQSILENNQFGRFSGITIGKVFKVSSAANMVDIMLLDGTMLKDVQVTVPYASSRCGSAGLPISEYEKDMKDKDLPLSTAKIKESDVYAVVGFLGGSIQRPICFGFLFPEENEVLCGTDQKGNQDGTQFLWKHESNVYVRVAKGHPAEEGEDRDGSGGTSITPEIEISHPSGTFIKIGNANYNAPSEEQLTEITNWDKEIRPFKKLNPKTNKADPAPTVEIGHSSGTYILIMPSGETWIDTTGNLGIEVHGDMTEEVDGNLTRTYHGDVTEVIEGTLSQTVKDNATITYEADLSETVEGDLTEQVDGTLDKTITGVATESYQSNLDKTVSGAETDDVTGAWSRSSDASIDDSAPSVTHN